jgi:hypothetical protein
MTVARDPMHPRLAELLDYAAAQRAGLLEAVHSVPEPLRAVRPAPGVWSVAEVLEHLHRTESGVASIVTERLGEALAAGLEAERDSDSVLGGLDRFRIPRPGRRVTAPSPVQPTGAMGWSEALARLAASREALLRAVMPGDGLALGQVVHPHPILGPLTLYQWILFVGQHEARHATQIRGLAHARADSVEGGR